LFYENFLAQVESRLFDLNIALRRDNGAECVSDRNGAHSDPVRQVVPMGSVGLGIVDQP
jgi:hypothetical protein